MSQIIYGIHPVEEALKSPVFEVEKILIASQRPNPRLQSILQAAQQRQIPVVYTRGETLEEMTRGASHQNVVAIAKGIAYADLDTILSAWKKEGARALLLILDGIQDPQNLGSLIRTALGCGAQGIIIPKDRAVGITPAVIKASAGAAAHLPVARVTNLSSTIDALKKEGLWVYGASGEAREKIFDVDLTVDLALVIGAEGKGIRPLVKKKCDRLFSIPMKGPVSSFNAAVSGGMILYEVMRQRSLRPDSSVEEIHRPVSFSRKEGVEEET